MRVLVPLITKQLNSRTNINCLRFYVSDTRCESAPRYVEQIDRACVAR
jgi:hypothetical protein